MIHFFKNLFTSKKQNSSAKKLASIEEFPKLNTDDRIRQIMFCGDSGDLKYYPLLRNAILNDPDKDVKMAALKRLHLFTSEPDVVLLMNSLDQQINVHSVEPYYSMALSRLKLISIEEFQQRADNGFKY